MTAVQSQRRVQLFNSSDPFEGFVRRLNPVFWMPLQELTGSIATNVLYTDPPGPDLLTNGDFAAWTGDNPDGWTLPGAEDGGNFITEVAGQARIVGNTLFRIRQTILTVGDTYRLMLDVNDVTAGAIIVHDASNGILKSYNTPGSKLLYGIAASTIYENYVTGGSSDIMIDNNSVRKTGELDALIAGTTTLGQAGWRGTHHALLFDGATSRMTVYNRASIQGLDEFTLWALFNPSSAGENDNGTLFSKSGEFELRFNSSSRDLIATVNYGTTNAQVITSTTLSADQWHSVGLRIDDSSKAIDLMIDGVEASYASEQAGSGSRVSTTNPLIVGNSAALDQTFAGLLDEVLVMDRALTPNEFALLHRLA